MSEPFVLLVLAIFAFSLVTTVGVVIVLNRGGNFSGRVALKPGAVHADVTAGNSVRLPEMDLSDPDPLLSKKKTPLRKVGKGSPRSGQKSAA